MAENERGLTPANENPWYVLMTLYGEQDGDEVDEELHERNRAAWNAWSCQAMDDEARAAAAVSSGVTVAELSAWPALQAGVTELHRAAMLQRNGADFAYPGLPDAADKVDMRRVAFVQCLVMQGAVFSGAAWFGSARFSRDAWFDLATFSGDARFDFATFSGAARFGSARFSGEARFHSAKFSGKAVFGSATFRGDASFGSATFSAWAVFYSATFSGVAVFGFATFSGVAVFASATFSGDARFDAATFSGEAGFNFATFSGNARFNSATFSAGAHFSEAQFGLPGQQQGVRFIDSQFAKPTNFRDAIFQARYPDFAGAVLHDKTTFTDHPDFWPKGVQRFPAQAKASCATIRHTLGRQGLPEAEHFFFRREMGFAGRIGPWWQWWPYRAFGWVSDYGHSIVTPFMWLCLLIVGGGYALAYGLAGAAAAVTFEQGLGLSFANVFNFLAFHKTFATEDSMAGLPPGLMAFSGFQSIAGVVLLFFLGLGLRTRFRMR